MFQIDDDSIIHLINNDTMINNLSICKTIGEEIQKRFGKYMNDKRKTFPKYEIEIKIQSIVIKLLN